MCAPSLRRIRCLLACAGLLFAAAGCTRPTEAPGGRGEPAGSARTRAKSAPRALPDREDGRADYAGDADGEADSRAEEREAEEEARMRARAMDSLARYRAPTCEAAQAKLLELLRRGRGRWHERAANGGLPEDLTAILTEAELWRSQAAPLCDGDARFERLRSLMDSIWRYPGSVSRAELDSRLAALDD